MTFDCLLVVFSMFFFYLGNREKFSPAANRAVVIKWAMNKRQGEQSKFNYHYTPVNARASVC